MNKENDGYAYSIDNGNSIEFIYRENVPNQPASTINNETINITPTSSCLRPSHRRETIKTIYTSNHLQQMYNSTDTDVFSLQVLLASWNLSDLFEFFEST